jgi:hypothetical protein
MESPWTRGAELKYRTIASALIAVAAVLGAAVTGLGSASAGTAASPPPARDLLGVSCVTARNCLAVGVDYAALKGWGGPLAETWNGATWRTVGVKLPPGATAGVLRGVSCVSAGRCVAVGSYDKGPGRSFALAGAWNGRQWALARLPAPGGVNSSLVSVSCASAASCVAVGSYWGANKEGIPLAESWNGKGWTQTRPPASGGGLAINGLVAVSCASPVRCAAISATRPPPVAVIEWWNGKTWSMRKGPALPGDIGAVQNSVSCPSAGICVTVGSAMFATATASFSGIWNGNSWRDATVPLPGGGTSGSMLSGVSCAAANRCVAVGAIQSYRTGSSTAAAATWNGNAWTVTSVPAPGKDKSSLFEDVTCLSATDCAAVGQVGPAGSANVTSTALSGFWNGKRWRLVAAK